eukprot:5561159-Ditylum_brightwellii.AAC.1
MSAEETAGGGRVVRQMEEVSLPSLNNSSHETSKQQQHERKEREDCLTNSWFLRPTLKGYGYENHLCPSLTVYEVGGDNDPTILNAFDNNASLTPKMMNRKHATPRQPSTATLMKSAWKLLSAYPSPDKEGANGGALAVRDDAA